MSARGTGAWRKEAWGPGCDTSVIVSAYWMIGAGKIQCHRNVIRYFRAVGRILHSFGYVVRSDVTGCYNCRPITGGTAPSAHAQGVAIDVNWDTNPYRTDRLVTDMPVAMTEAIEALRTDAGVTAGRWGGDWDGRPDTPQGNYDAMHIETLCTPEELRSGFSIPIFDLSKRSQWPLLDLHEKGGAVKQLQGLIGMPSSQWDGYFGPVTQRAVKVYQAARGMGADGVVGLGTWTAILTDQPTLAQGGIPPVKPVVE